MTGVGADVYGPGVLPTLPDHVVASSIGCADHPVTVVELAPGETVLDLGSGGGLDVLLSARRVGPTGKAYRLDMTEEMVELARRHQADAGVANAEFLLGTSRPSLSPTVASTWCCPTPWSACHRTRRPSSGRPTASCAREGGWPSRTWWPSPRRSVRFALTPRPGSAALPDA